MTKGLPVYLRDLVVHEAAEDENAALSAVDRLIVEECHRRDARSGAGQETAKTQASEDGPHPRVQERVERVDPVGAHEQDCE